MGEIKSYPKDREKTRTLNISTKYMNFLWKNWDLYPICWQANKNSISRFYSSI